MVENFLKLSCGCAPLVRCQVGLAAQVNGVQRLASTTEFVGSNRGKRFDCLAGAARLQGSSCVDGGQIIGLHNRVFRKAFGQVSGQRRSLSGITRQTQCDGRYSFNISAGRESQRGLRLLLCLVPVAHERLAQRRFGHLYPAPVSFSSARWADSDARRISSRALENSPPQAAVSDSPKSITSSNPGFPTFAPAALARRPSSMRASGLGVWINSSAFAELSFSFRNPLFGIAKRWQNVQP